MKISPCGWFCFEEPAGWVVSDTTESILLSHPPSGAIIEVTSARKENRVRETDVWTLLENSMASMPGAPFEETSMYKIPSGIECLKSLQANGHVLLGKAYVFWSNYSVVLSLRATTEPFRLELCMQGFNFLLDSLQPLTVDG